MEYLFVYLLQLSNIFLALAFGLSVVILFPIWTFLQERMLGRHEDVEHLKRPIIITLIIIFLLILFPRRETIVLMAGIHFGKQIMQQVDNSPKLSKINKIIELELDNYIKELQGVRK